MSDIIKLLPDSVANQIAAGEVIQRPSSVIKELVENAVDAGADDIRIEVKDAGKTLIRVVDNGIGMSVTDVRMAFERHATSKITSADDLFHLRSMGFRGEALPSICAISEVEVRTRTASDSVGTRLVTVGSHVETQEPCVCDAGTVISVKKLFFNVPARRKFLKSDNVELSNIMREFERLALVNNHIRMSIDTGTRHIDLRKATLRGRIEELWKNNLSPESLIPVEVDTSMVKIEGFISRPEFARRRNPLQFLIVNGRNMRHPYFHKAILSCYDSLIATDTQPCYFLRFTVDPSTIDVNIHPTKHEIKFEYEHEIWPIIVSAVKTSLGKFSAVPSIDFSSDAIPLQPLSQGEMPSEPRIGVRSDYNPFRSGGGAQHHSSHVDSNWETLYRNFSNPDTQSGGAASGRSASGGIESRLSREFGFEDTPRATAALFTPSEERGENAAVCMQVLGKYIVTTSREGLLLIDQHRAHVRVLFDEFIHKSEKSEIVSQSLMFPEQVTLDETQRAALAEVSDDLRSAGFGIEYESDDIWKIVAVPALPGNVVPQDMLLKILDSVSESSVNYGNDASPLATMREKVALVMARAAAVRGGAALGVAEMESLVGRLFALPESSLTPDGNPVYRLLNDAALARLLSL